MPQEALERANNSFFAKIIQAKQTTIQDVRTNNVANDLAEQNEEPLD